MKSHTIQCIRRIIAEDNEWNLVIVPPLSDLCISILIDSFSQYPVLKEISAIDHKYTVTLIEGLPPNLPLHITIPLIENPKFWKNCYINRWNFCDVYLADIPWKKLYLERNLSELISKFRPVSKSSEITNFNHNLVEDTISISADFIQELKINYVQPSEDFQSSANEQNNELADDISYDRPKMGHFNSTFLFNTLHKLESLIICYGLHDIGMNFDWAYFTFSSQEAISIAKGLKYSSSLLHFGLTKSYLKCCHIKLILASLSDHPSITSLDFSHNKISDLSFNYFGKLLSFVNCRLISIDLSNNIIGFEGALLFSLGLEKNSTLKYLNLRLNKLGDDGSEHLFRCLMKNNTLCTLNLSSNLLSEISCKILAETIAFNTRLISLDLSCNNFSETGGKYLQDRMEQNYNLLEFNLALTGISQESDTFISQMLERNSKMQTRL